MTHRKPWHRGTYHVTARRVREYGYANPDTRCRRCGRQLHEIRHRNGKPARWTAGHLVDGQVGGDLAPECSVCSCSSGAALTNRQRAQRDEDPYR